MSAPSFIDDNLTAYFKSEYDDDSFSCVARFTLLDEPAGGRELVTAEVYTNGNEWGVRAWTWVRGEPTERDSIRLVNWEREGESMHYVATLRVDAEELTAGGAVMLSETFQRLLIRAAKKLLGVPL